MATHPSGVSLTEAHSIVAGDPTAKPTFVVHKFGFNGSTAAGDCIMEPGGAFPYLAYGGTPLAMRVKAGGNPADDSDSGTGARSITIGGLDSSFSLVQETVNTEGAGVGSATTTTFARIHRVSVASAGSGRANAAAVVIEDSGGAADYATVLVDEGQGVLGYFTVPAGYYGYLTHVMLSTDVASGTATVVVRGFQRSNANDVNTPFSAQRLFFRELSLSRSLGAVERNFEEPIRFDEYTDIWFEGTPSTGTPEVSVAFSLICVPK